MDRHDLDRLPEVMFHGTCSPAPLLGPCQPAASNRWWTAVGWDVYDEWVDGIDCEAGIPYANIVWEALGLCDPGRADVPEWALDVRDFEDLGRRVGMLFVTDAHGTARAETLYGPLVEIDTAAPDILGAVHDPNARTHAGVILLVRAGAPLPLLDRAAVERLASGAPPVP